MTHKQTAWSAYGTLLAILIISGCASDRTAHRQETSIKQQVAASTVSPPSNIQLADSVADDSTNTVESAIALDQSLMPTTSLNDLETQAVNQNPTLIRLYREYQAATARARYVDELPDPKVGANVFGNPIETAAGSQRANFSVSQLIPWLEKLNAQEQQACFEALAIRSEYQSAKLKALADARVGWYRLYVIDKLIETTKVNQQLLNSIIEVANARVSTGAASQGDVLLGTLELSRLEEQLLMLKRRRLAIEAELNRVVSRPAATPVNVPDVLKINLPELSANQLYETALSYQPELDAARLRTQATRWGIEVARLSRRPEVAISANYFLTDNNRPPTKVVNVGEDPWSLGAQVSIPLWREKYDAIRDEATWKYLASHDSLRQLQERYDALTLDLWSEAQRASETAKLYRQTVLPQAEQTLQADQDAYANGSVEFDRVVRDYRNLLTLELEYHRARGDLAIALAQIQRAIGQDI